LNGVVHIRMRIVAQKNLLKIRIWRSLKSTLTMSKRYALCLRNNNETVLYEKFELFSNAVMTVELEI